MSQFWPLFCLNAFACPKSPNFNFYRRLLDNNYDMYVCFIDLLSKVLGGLCATSEASGYWWSILWPQLPKHSIQNIPRPLPKGGATNIHSNNLRIQNLWLERLCIRVQVRQQWEPNKQNRYGFHIFFRTLPHIAVYVYECESKMFLVFIYLFWSLFCRTKPEKCLAMSAPQEFVCQMKSIQKMSGIRKSCLSWFELNL